MAGVDVVKAAYASARGHGGEKTKVADDCVRRKLVPMDERWARVLLQIERRLADRIRLPELARLAAFSNYHFLREFRRVFSAPPLSYVRRLRMERAARMLMADLERPVLDIALDCGYDSHAAFSRAFRAVFALSPAVFRRRWTSPQNSNFGAAPGSSDVYHWVEKQGGALIRLAPTRALACPVCGSYSEAPARAWRQAAGLLRSLQPMPEHVFGAGLDDPRVTAANLCRYTVLIPWPQPEDRATTLIPGGKFAAFPYRGPAAGIGARVSELLRSTPGYRGRGWPALERYPTRVAQDSARLECDLLLPVEV